MIKRILYLILLCLTAPVVQAQPTQFFHPLFYRGWVVSKHGDEHVAGSQRQPLFATWDGINRFDGYNFKTYKARQGNYISLTNNRADRMYEDRYGFLWLLTYDNRVHRFDPKTETFEQVPAAGEEGSTYNIHAIQVLPDGTVWLLTEHDGAIRVVTPSSEELYDEIRYLFNEVRSVSCRSLLSGLSGQSRQSLAAD